MVLLSIGFPHSEQLICIIASSFAYLRLLSHALSGANAITANWLLIWTSHYRAFFNGSSSAGSEQLKLIAAAWNCVWQLFAEQFRCNCSAASFILSKHKACCNRSKVVLTEWLKLCKRTFVLFWTRCYWIKRWRPAELVKLVEKCPHQQLGHYSLNKKMQCANESNLIPLQSTKLVLVKSISQLLTTL